MKTYQSIAILAIIGSIMAVSIMDEQEAYADEMLFKMMEINEKLTKLQNSDSELDQMSIAKSAFQMKQIKNGLLEINEMNGGEDERYEKFYEYLKDNYQSAFEKYEKDVKEYSKENGLSASEKKLVSEIIKSKLTFETQEAKENSKKEVAERISTELKKTESKEKYQKLVNKIGIKLASEANGGIVEKIHHKVVMKEIIASKQLDIAIPAIDRIITQVNDEKIKEKLYAVKDKIQKIQDRKSKQEGSETFELSQGPKVGSKIPIQFNQFEIGFGGILNSVIDNEIIESLNEIEQVYEEFEVKTIESMLDEEVISSLKMVIEVAEEDEEQLEKEKEKQRKESRENKSRENKSSNADLGSDNSDKRNENANDSKGKSTGKGKGK